MVDFLGTFTFFNKWSTVLLVMADLKITKGLDVPLKGAPVGELRELQASGRPVTPDVIALDLSPFDHKRFRLLVKPGDRVKRGQPLVFDKGLEQRVFVAPAGGVVQEIVRGLKRRLLYIPIQVDAEEEVVTFSPLDPTTASREQILERIAEGGLLPFIRQRPFDLLADPRKKPRDIFIQAVNSGPFAIPPEMQLEGHHEDLKWGLETLRHLTSGRVHVVMREGLHLHDQDGISFHTIRGPHPSGLASTHISLLAPITKVDETVWTLSLPDAIAIGHLLRTGRFLTERVIAIAGEGFVEGRTGFFHGRLGMPIASLTEGRLPKGDVRFISGDPLTGRQVQMDGFLGFNDSILSVIPERKGREPLHFFRLGLDKFSASRAYLSGWFKKKSYSFDTNLHGETRSFIIGSPYEKVVPLPINPMLLVKAILAEDYEGAEKLGLLEVAPEDFSLPAFVDPSKIEMMGIVKRGLNLYAAEVTDSL